MSGSAETPDVSDAAAGGPAPPRVSFLVLGYNQERYIRAAIEAAFAQTHAPLQIVLSDDCSADATFEIMREMAEAYDGPHEVVLNRNDPNLGIVGHVNRLMEIADGDLVFKVDGDDVSLPERTAKLVAAWEASGRTAKSLFSAVVRVDAEGRELELLTLDQGHGLSMRTIIEDPTPYNIVKKNLWVLGAAAAWTPDLFETFGPIDRAAIVEDAVIPFRAAALGGIAYVDEPLVRYRVGGISPDGRDVSGFEQLYGQKIRLARLNIGSKKAILKDLERGEVPRAAEIRALCEAYIDENEHRIALIEAGRAGRLAMLPGSLARALRRRNPAYLLNNLKYVFDTASMRMIDARR